ncbi:hypothetical protein ACFOZ0_03880 [Streptomyces yaanensis]|uniref:Uncharacterized protein n=1 Tax=Streptomyces yaanensis TaxID=1142239 RepID=A0ABV7S837_9ACTN|nr:hypothetical protein [Streptomyces sp. CGMCC 4.7035]WNC00008.1 hypothetical protein Q2K21_19095 [Streptomyces sp. CGMCC 4.7035]
MRRRVVAAGPLLLRQGRVWRGGSGWTYIHHEWLRKQRFTDADTQFAFDKGWKRSWH